MAEAEEVFLLMRRDFRVSRNVRAWWFFQHIDKNISVEEHAATKDDIFSHEIRHQPRKLSSTPQDTDGVKTVDSACPDLAVVGITPRKVDEESARPEEDVKENVFRVRPDTVVTFLSKYYRLVFVLDLSPSINTIDLKENRVLHAKIFHCLKGCLEGVIKPFQVPGGSRWFSPQIFITVLAYTPFLCVPADQVLANATSCTECNRI